ncbi:MAG: hypothetical protein IJC52_00875, partial [Clostridia bacterium]|nr:hypothetical protein [Clostridia bacterium]
MERCRKLAFRRAEQPLIPLGVFSLQQFREAESAVSFARAKKVRKEVPFAEATPLLTVLQSFWDSKTLFSKRVLAG